MMLTLLPKDPKCLYAFWDKLPEDKKSLSEGMERLPAVYLRISNLTDGSTLMVRVNDFSDSWYINVPSAGCSYLAEIGRKLPGGEFVAIAASNVTSTAGNCLGSTENIAFADYTAVREGDFETDAPQEYRPGEIFDYMSASFIDGSEGNDSSNSSEGSKGSEGNEANDSNISGAAHGNARGIFRTVSSADLPASGPFSSKG